MTGGSDEKNLLNIGGNRFCSTVLFFVSWLVANNFDLTLTFAEIAGSKLSVFPY